MNNEKEIDVIDLAAAEMIPDDAIAEKFGLTHEERYVAHLRLAKGLAVHAIKELGENGNHEKIKEWFLEDFEATYKDMIGAL